MFLESVYSCLVSVCRFLAGLYRSWVVFVVVLKEVVNRLLVGFCRCVWVCCCFFYKFVFWMLVGVKRLLHGV